MKKHTTTKYVLLDLGNTCFEACIYQNGKNSNFVTFNTNVSFKQIINALKLKNFAKVFVVASCKKATLNNYLKQINQFDNQLFVHVLSKTDFTKDIDFSNINKGVVIGDDILLLAYYLIKHYKKNAIVCLGTVYFSIVTIGKRIISVGLMPNLTTGLETICSLTSIPNSLIPDNYDKDIGLNTPDAFSAGIKVMFDGYLQNLAKQFKLNSKKIIVCGGQKIKFKSLANKYDFIDNATLTALAELITNKRW